jgi:hypothetical protein
MTFLELCNALARECGASPNITTVVGATGENSRFVEWIKQANKDVQGLWGDWKFNHATFSDSTTTGSGSITAPDDHDAWDRKRFLLDGSNIDSIDYVEWLDGGTTGTGKPSEIVIMPNNSLKLVPTPDGIYSVTGDYYKAPQELAANADIPRIPAAYHDVIWLYAMVNYAYFEAAEEVLLRAKERLMERLPRLEASQLPNNHHFAQSSTSIVVEVI